MLDDCRPSIALSLVDDAGYTRLRDQCGRLPVQFSAFWGLETALGNPDPVADLLIEIRKGSARHALLGGLAPSAIDALCDGSAEWTALRRFAQAWSNHDDPRAALVRNLWVEFDLIAAARATPAIDAVGHPSVFWGPEPDARGDWDKVQSLLSFVTDSFSEFPKTLPLEPIERAMRTLPEDGHVFQLGAMTARGDVMLRVCVNHLRTQDMPGWLRQQGWPGDIAALEGALDPLGSMVRSLAFDLDYTSAGLGPKLGVECYQHWPVLDVAQWLPFLNHAAALGLIVPSKRDAIAAFPASTEVPWADQFASGRKHGFVFPVVYRNIHHVKLVFVADRFTEAKAYLGVTRPGVKMQYPFPNIPAGEPDEWLANS